MLSLPISSLKKSEVLRLIFIALVALVVGAGVVFALNYQTLREARSVKKESSKVEFSKPQKNQDREPPVATYSGIIKPLGPSIYMQGTHYLEDDSGGVVAILQGGRVSSEFLGILEGQFASVVGRVARTVEGGKKLIIVDEVHLK